MAQFTNQAQLRYGNSIANSKCVCAQIICNCQTIKCSRTGIYNRYNIRNGIILTICLSDCGLAC